MAKIVTDLRLPLDVSPEREEMLLALRVKAETWACTDTMVHIDAKLSELRAERKRRERAAA